MQKRKPLRLPKLLKAANGAPCMSCGAQDGTVVAAHSPMRHFHGGGMGQKVDDCFTAYLCAQCHDAVDGRGQALSRELRESMWLEAHRDTVRYWFAYGVVA